MRACAWNTGLLAIVALHSTRTRSSSKRCQSLPFVDEWHSPLAFDLYAAQFEFIRQRFLIHALQEPGPAEGAVHLDRSVNDHPTDFVLGHTSTSLRLCVFVPLR